MDIDYKLLASSCLISSTKTKGSGFFLHFKNSLFLITAKHVIIENEQLITSEILVSSPTVLMNDLKMNRFKIDLEKSKKIFNNDDDIIVIHLGNENKKEGDEIAFDYNDGIEKDGEYHPPLVISTDKIASISEIILANETYLFGYPTSLYIVNNQQFFNLEKPLIRKGIVSYVNREKNTFILDCAVYPGNSGGPIFQSSIIDGKPVFKLIGIVSQYIPYETVWYNNREKISNNEYSNSGYTYAFSTDILLKIIE